MEDLDKLKFEGQINCLHHEFEGVENLCYVKHLEFIAMTLKREDIILIKQALEIVKEHLK